MSAPKINIDAPMATCTDLTQESVKESKRDELLVIWSMASESISQVLEEEEEIKAEPKLSPLVVTGETWDAKAIIWLYFFFY